MPHCSRSSPFLRQLGGLFACMAVATLLMGAKAATKRPRPTTPGAQGTTDDLPPLDLLPPDEPETPVSPTAPATPAPAAPVPAPVPLGLRIALGGGLDLSGTGFSPTGGGFLSARKSLLASGPLAFDAGLRFGYGMRLRQEFVTDESGDRVPAAVFYAHTGDVSAILETALTPSANVPLELLVEAGVGVAWRSGRQTLLDRRIDASGAGLSTHVAGTAAWKWRDAWRFGLRLEALAQPQAVRVDVPAMPTDLGAFRAMAVVELVK